MKKQQLRKIYFLQFIFSFKNRLSRYDDDDDGGGGEELFLTACLVSNDHERKITFIKKRAMSNYNIEYHRSNGEIAELVTEEFR